MFGLSKLVIVAVTTSLVSGGALVALTGGAGGSDRGLDTDGDGRFDWLLVEMPLTVDEADHYNVWAILGTREAFGRNCFSFAPPPLDPNLPPIRDGLPGPSGETGVVYPISWTSVRQFLEPGDHAITLAFRGTDIGYAGVDGPYVVEAHAFADGQWGSDPRMGGGLLYPQPSGSLWTYTTGPYDAGAFEEPRFAIRFTGTWEDSGVDADGDGLYDHLVLKAPADVSLAGGYYYDASLVIPSDEFGAYWVTSTYGTVDLAVGRQTVEARFDGGEIWRSGHSGSFDFMLNVYYGGGYAYPDGTIGDGTRPDGREFDVYGDSLCGATAEYRHEAWEELVEPARFTGVFADRGEDRDGDGLFDVLAVDAEVDVAEATWFEFSGQLMTPDGSAWIAGDYQGLYLDVGVQTLTLRFSGGAIHASGMDGPYRADMALGTRMYYADATHETAAYAHTEFDPDETTRDAIWIANLSADASAILVTVERGLDLLDVVMDGTLYIRAFGRDGTLAFEGKGGVSLPSGGDTQSFTFAWSPDPGTYVVQAALDSPWGTDLMELVVTV